MRFHMKIVASNFGNTNIMKAEVTLTLVFIFLQVISATEYKPFLPMPMMRTCIKQRNLNKDEVESVINEASVYLPEDNPEFNEFLGCYWKKKGYQDENGTIHYDKVVELVENFPGEKFGANPESGSVGLQVATKVVNECKHVPKGITRGQTAAKVQNCITKHLEEYFRNEKRVIGSNDSSSNS